MVINLFKKAEVLIYSEVIKQHGNGDFSVKYDSSKIKNPNNIRVVISVVSMKQSFLHMGMKISTPSVNASSSTISFHVKEQFLKENYMNATSQSSVQNGLRDKTFTINTNEKNIVLVENHSSLNSLGVSGGSRWGVAETYVNNNKIAPFYSNKFPAMIFLNMNSTLLKFDINSTTNVRCVATSDNGGNLSYTSLSSAMCKSYVLRDSFKECTVNVYIMEVI